MVGTGDKQHAFARKDFYVAALVVVLLMGCCTLKNARSLRLNKL